MMLKIHFVVFAVCLVFSAGAVESPSFRSARPVWPAELVGATNAHVRFTARYEGSEPAVLRIASAYPYRIRKNGAYVGYGPARGPKGWFRVDEWPLSGGRIDNRIEIEVSGANAASYYFMKQPPFLEAEVLRGDTVLVATGDSNGFAAETTERVQKTVRYSGQRLFSEVYRFDGRPPRTLSLSVLPPVRLLPRIAPYPDFRINDRLEVIARAKATWKPDAPVRPNRQADWVSGKDLRTAFDKSEVEVNSWTDAERTVLSDSRSASGSACEATVLEQSSITVDAGLNDCGFPGMTVEVRRPGRLLFRFDEILVDGRVDYGRLGCVNVIEWIFDHVGRYEIESFEPYGFRYAEIAVPEGEMEISGLHVRTYKNPQAARASFRCSDPALERIFAAARETFAQNAVDVFTDCPGRERAGWLCDSYFIGRVNRLLCGDATQERLFLENFAMPDRFDCLPEGMVPMCYPGDHPTGRFIPNWAMWLVLEAEEYLQRSGDRDMIEMLRPRFVSLVSYMNGFRNADGLLEKLPEWVFVEWSRSNALVQDVNYPSNMMWAEVLDAMDRLYGMPELATEARGIRETVRRQSWTGTWFCDNAVRQPDGSLKLSGECTETCQYYAFYFHTATPETHAGLWKTLVDDFGPRRRKTKKHPEVWPSNAFIGNYLRLELLSRVGLERNVLDESKDYFLYMADRTGTLWEHDNVKASCCHGFASHVAVNLFRDVLGVRSVDAVSRKVDVKVPEGVGLEWCEGVLPQPDGTSVEVKWRKGERPRVTWADPAFSPGYFWMWNARLETPKLIAQLEDMRAHGIRSVCIHPFPRDFRKGLFESSMEPDYLTTDYLDVFAKVVNRARELGMDAWLYDEGGWPSGGACGLVAKSDAEGRFRRRRLCVTNGMPTVVTEPYAGNPPVSSIVEKGATERFLSLTHDVYAKTMPDDIGKTVRFAFMDEPAMLPAVDGDRTSIGWTSDFDEAFKAKKGYDLRPHAGEILERKDETDDRLARLRIDYHEVRADLFVERFMLPIRDWCRAHGMLSGGHLNGEDVPERTSDYGHGDLMRSLRTMDCPGVDVIWKQLFPLTEERVATTLPFPRYAASAMHQNGGRFAMSESFAIFGDGCTPDQMKWLVDYQMVRGINRFVFGYYALSNARRWMLLFEPHSGPVTPYWDFEPHWFKYIERTATFLAQGRPGAEIAVLYDVRGLWAGGADKEAAAQNHYAVATALDRMNRDYDFVNDKSLAEAEVKTDGVLRVGAMDYRALVLPTSKWLSDGARAKVEAFCKAGGLVTDGADLSKLPETLTIRGRDALQFRVMKRIDGDRHIYYVVNEDPWERQVRIDFKEKGPIVRYDVERDGLAGVPMRDGSVDWPFPGCGTAIFVTGTGEELPPPCQYKDEPFLELKDGWTIRRLVSHEAGKENFIVRPVDEQPSPTALGDWRPQFGEAFCGKAVYRIEFESGAERNVQIDLGRVCWCAGIRLNGEDCGNRFFGPFRWEVKFVKGRNVLEVTVANLLSTLLGDRAVRSRIAADYPPSPNYEGRQGPADLQNRESGLFGPVAIYEREQEQEM